MVDMIPTTITNSKDLTTGEKKVYRFLQQLLEEESSVVWYEPQALGRYSDFLLWHPLWGLLAIEVKDWSKSNFKEINKSYFKGNFYKDKNLVSVTNPAHQARQFSLKLINQFKQNDAFVIKAGNYQGKIIFPITYCVVYTNILREEAEKLGLLHESINHPCKILFKDDLDTDLSQPAQLELVKQKLGNAFQDIRFKFQPLTYAQEKALRYMIFPEIRVNNFDQEQLFDAQPQDFKALDIEQEMIAKNIGEGHRILKGVAGSGKSLVLACRAKYLHTIYPTWKILVVCYNNTLCNHIKEMLGEDFSDKIQIRNFHTVVKEVTGANLKMLEQESNNDYNNRIGNILKTYLASHVLDFKYDAILIDEGQDFAQDWIQGLSMLLSTETDSLLFCYDPAQNIFNREKPSWKSIGLKVQGKKPTELKKCYRNTKAILDVARSFLNPKTLNSLQSDDIYDRALDPDTGECNLGVSPITYLGVDFTELANLVVRKCAQLIKRDIRPQDIAILIAKNTSNSNYPHVFAEAFKQYCPEVDHKFILTTAEKKQLDLKHPSIKILNVESSKGLEFSYVFLLGYEAMPRLDPKTNRDLDSEKKLAYVGLTRAKEFLYLLSAEEKGFFAEVKSIISQINTLTEEVKESVDSEPEQVASTLLQNKEQKELPTNAYQPWTEDEEVQLIDLFTDGKSIHEIASHHQRQSGAIRSRLKKLRLLE